MPNKNYIKGYKFERRVAAFIKEVLLKHLCDTEAIYPPCIIHSAGSKGICDMVCGITLKINKRQLWFGVQCKSGYISHKLMKSTINKCIRNGIVLFFATRGQDNAIIFYPSLDKYIRSEYNILSRGERHGEMV